MMRWIIIGKIGIYFFFICLIIFTVYFLIKTITRTKYLYSYQRKQQLSNRLNHNYYVPVSILITTHNDEKKIEKTIKELLMLDYKIYEIIVIDMASTDNTVNKIIETFKLEKIDRPIRMRIKTEKIKEIYQTNKQEVKITLLKKKSKEIHDAINTGINIAEYPYFININTNYHLEANSLKKLVNPILEDDHIIISQGISRMGFLDDKKNYHFPKGIMNKANVVDKINKKILLGNEANSVSEERSFTLFQKEAAIKCLGYAKEEIGENFELIRKIKESFGDKKEACMIKYVDDAICYIDASKTGFFKKQRQIQKSILRSYKKHKKIVLNYQNKIKDYFYKKFFSFYELYCPWLKLITFIIIIGAIIITKPDVKILLLFLGSYLLFYIFLSIYNFLVKLITEGNRLSISLFFQTVIVAIIHASLYKIITDFAKITAIFGYKK